VDVLELWDLAFKGMQETGSGCPERWPYEMIVLHISKHSL